MVLKKMLKGVGRLMLTTGLLCGVGLFLCSSEVKAAAGDVTVVHEGDKFIIKYEPDTADTPYSFANAKILKKDGSTVICDATLLNPGTITSGAANVAFPVAELSDDDFIKCFDTAKLDNTDIESDYTIEVNAKLDCTTKSTTDVVSTNSAKSKNIYKIFLKDSKNDTFYKTSASYDVTQFTVKAHNISYTGQKKTVAPTCYVYGGKSIEVKTPANPDYYVNVFTGTTQPLWDDGSFKDSGASFTFENISDDTDLEVQYFPKMKEIYFDLPTGGVNKVYLNNTGYRQKSAPLHITNASGELSLDDKKVIYEQITIKSSITNEGNNISSCVAAYDANFANAILEFGTGTSSALVDKNKVGNASVVAVAKNTSRGTETDLPSYFNISYKPLALTVYAYPEKLQVFKGDAEIADKATDTINITSATQYTAKIYPYGADQTIIDPVLKYGIKGEILDSFELDRTDNKNILTVKGKKGGIQEVGITVKANGAGGVGTITDGTVTLTEKVYYIAVKQFSAEKTATAINESDENYITVGDYKLDIAELVKKYAKDSEGNKTDVSIKSIEITDGKDYAEKSDSTKIKGKKEGTAKIKVTLDDGTEIKDIKVDVYPKPTVKYNSERTLSVTMPTKVSLGFDKDKNIKKVTGFKLVLEDGSGSTLYEYKDDKYQKALSSSSDRTVTYTVSASDVEGMVTSAASNGKFSGDTTSVKFKVVPMGYQQNKSSEEMIKTEDEINGKTDSVTVYKVTASGTNFATTSAFGLAGQSVTLTAQPNSGYTFKQWSDGNTSNPRTVTISSSGTRNFQAVAGDRVGNNVNGTGANGTGANGTDNSSLYDDVPKTAESNSAIWLIIFMVFAVMGTTYALYLQLRAANSKNDK